MSIDGEMWTREVGDLRDVLPRAADSDFDESGGAFAVESSTRSRAPGMA